VRGNITNVTNSGGTVDSLFIQFVSDPLAAQTISGTATAVLAVRESNLNVNARAQMVIRAVSNDGTTFRGTLMDYDTAGLSNEYTTASGVLPGVNYPRGHVNTTLTSTTLQEGDRLVIEMGCRSHAGTAGTLTFQCGDNGPLDMLTDESTTTGMPWIEFSQTLIWGAQYTVTSYSADWTALSGNLTTAFTNAGNSDVLYLSAGDWAFTGNSLGTDTSRTKMMRVRPADGVARSAVNIGNGVTSATLQQSKYVSFENVTVPRSCFFQGERIQFVGCRVRQTLQIDSTSKQITIEGNTIGGDADTNSGSYGVLYSLDAPQRCEDSWVLRNDIGYIMTRDAIEARLFTNAVFDGNSIHDMDHNPGDHEDCFRTFLGGIGLRFRNNLLYNGNNGQGFFINGGPVSDILVENNVFGSCVGSFRCFAIDDVATYMRVANNTLHDSASFSNGVAHVGVWWFNNMHTSTGTFGIISGASVADFNHDFNVFGGTLTAITPGGSESTTAPTLVDAANNNFQLASGSASGINLGVASYLGIPARTADMTGAARAFPCEAGAIEGTG
jgi:hypothetical protein